MKFIYENLTTTLLKRDVEDIKAELYDNMLDASLKSDKDLLSKILKFAEDNSITLDLCIDDGLLGVLAAKKGNYEVLEILCNYDKNLIPTYGVEMLGYAASNDQINCIKFLLGKGTNPIKLKDTTAYHNYQEVENIFNQHLEEEHQVNISGDISSTTNNLIETI
jgi:hypothetical protein